MQRGQRKARAVEIPLLAALPSEAGLASLLIFGGALLNGCRDGRPSVAQLLAGNLEDDAG